MAENIKHKMEVFKIMYLLDSLESKALGILGLNQCEDIQQHNQQMYRTLFYEFYQQYKNQNNLEFLVSYTEKQGNDKQKFDIVTMTDFKKKQNHDNIISCFISGVYHKDASRDINEVLEKIQRQEMEAKPQIRKFYKRYGLKLQMKVEPNCKDNQKMPNQSKKMFQGIQNQTTIRIQ